MTAAEIEQAYEPFARALEEGGFRQPGDAEGWTAEMVGAHVILNNDTLTRVARELIATGTTAYDNQTAVDDAVLSEHVASVGASAALATDVRRSARDLAAAYADLGESGPTNVPVMIWHDGVVVRDEPAALAGLIEGNATFHLSMHLKQMLALREGTGE